MGSSRCATPRSRRRHVKSVPNSEPWSVWMRLVVHKRISRAVATEREAIDLVRYFKRLGLAGLDISGAPRTGPGADLPADPRGAAGVPGASSLSERDPGEHRGRVPRLVGSLASRGRFYQFTARPLASRAPRLRAQLYQIGARPFPETRRSGDWVSPTLVRCSHRLVGVHRDSTRAHARPGRAPSAEYRVVYDSQAERDDRPLVSALVAGLLVTVPYEVAGWATGCYGLHRRTAEPAWHHMNHLSSLPTAVIPIYFGMWPSRPGRRSSLPYIVRFQSTRRPTPGIGHYYCSALP
jgi:hypothetical protein